MQGTEGVKLNRAGSDIDSDTSEPNQVFNSLDALDNHFDNFDGRLKKIFVFIAGNRPEKEQVSKQAGIAQGGGVFQSMLGRLGLLQRKSDELYETINRIEQALGL